MNTTTTIASLLMSIETLLALIEQVIAQSDTIHDRFAIARETRADAYRKLGVRLSAEAAKGSTGAAGKACDVIVRDILFTRGLYNEGDFRTRKNFFDDLEVTWEGKRYPAEIKTGGNFGPSDTDPWMMVDGHLKVNGQAWTDDDLRIRREGSAGRIVRKDGLLFLPLVDRIVTFNDLLKQTAVFETQEFIDYLHDNERDLAPRAGYRGIFHVTRNGKQAGASTYDKDGTHSLVVAFQPQPLARLRNLVGQDIADGTLTTLDQFLRSR